VIELKKHYGSLLRTNKLLVLIIIVVLAIIILSVTGSQKELVDFSSNKTVNNTLSISKTNENTNSLTETEQVIKKTLSEKGFCEDYNLKEGDSIDLGTHHINLLRIGKNMVLLKLDNKTMYLRPEENEDLGNFLVEVKKDGIFYFQSNDPVNIVKLRIGCKSSNEDPKDKYVREKGLETCKKIYDECKQTFDLN